MRPTEPIDNAPLKANETSKPVSSGTAPISSGTALGGPPPYRGPSYRHTAPRSSRRGRGRSSRRGRGRSSRRSRSSRRN